jgi:hypothetical protein
VSANQLHHLHLGDEVCQVLVRGVICEGGRGGEEAPSDYMGRLWGWGQVKKHQTKTKVQVSYVVLKKVA